MKWPHGDPSVVVRAVLAQPAYGTHGSTNPAPQASLVELAWKWFVEHLLAPLFAPIARAVGASHAAGTAVGIALVCGALLALGFVAFRLATAFVRAGVAREPGVPGTSAVLAATRSSAGWRATARAAALRGEYAPAIAALFAAALAALDESALVAYDGARAPSEYRRLVRRSRPPAAPPFDELSVCFVRAAYAPRAPLRADFEAAERAYAAFVPALGA